MGITLQEEMGIAQVLENVRVSLNSELVEKIGVVSVCFILSYMLVKHIWSSAKMEKEPTRVLVTGAAGAFIFLPKLFLY